MINYLLISILSFTLCLAYRKFAIANKIIDKPTKKNVHKQNVPKSIGIILILLFSINLIISDFNKIETLNSFFNYKNILRIWPLYVALIISSIFFFIDDLYNINPLSKLFFQIFISYVLIGAISFPIFFAYLKIEILISLFVIVYFINTFNFIDGFDGMFSLNLIFILISINLIVYDNEDLKFIYDLNFILFFIMLPYIILNKTSNFKLFLGDSGSATIGIFLSWEFLVIINIDNIKFLLLIFMYPCLDVGITLINKIINKKNIFSRDFDYFFLKPIKKYKKTHNECFFNFLVFYFFSFLIIYFYKITNNNIYFFVSIFLNFWMIKQLNYGLNFLPKFWK